MVIFIIVKNKENKDATTVLKIITFFNIYNTPIRNKYFTTTTCFTILSIMDIFDPDFTILIIKKHNENVKVFIINN